MASEMALVTDKGGNSRANSRMARVGRGLESVGGMTESTFHRLTNVMGSVVRLPVVLMTKVGGFGSPQPASLPSSLKPVEDRVFQLEIQMKNLEDKYNSTTVTELSLEKPPISRSLLLDMEAEGASVERVQLLEDRINLRMESIEKAMSAIQDQLAMVNLKPAATVVYQRQESMPNEEHHDAEQQSDNSEALEAKIGEAPEASFTSTTKAIEKSGDVREPHSVAALGSAESIESEALEAKSGKGSFGASFASTTEAVKKLDTESSGDIGKPQLGTEVVERSDEDVGVSPASAKGQQLAATLEELHEGFVMEPSAAAAAVKFVEIARADHTEESCIPPPSSEARLEEPRINADSEQPAQEEDIDTATKSSTVEEAQEDHVKEPLVAAPVQELAAGEESNSALTSVEPQVASKDVELPSTGLGELLQEDRGIVVPAAESSSEESHVKERALQEDSGAEPQVVPEFFEEVSESVPGANFEEPKLPSLISSEAPQEEFAKEPLAESPQIPVTQEGSDRALASFEPQEQPSAHVESEKVKEHAREDATDESGSMVEESPLSSSKESQEDVTESSAGAPSVEPATDEYMVDTAFASAPKDGGVKESQEAVEESSAGAPTVESVTEEDLSEDADVALASSETEHVEDPVHAPEDATDESSTMLEESSFSSSKKSQEDVTESSSMEPATEEDQGSERSDMTLAFAPKDGADVKESEEDVAGAPSIKPPTEEVSSEGSGLALASSRVEEPSAGAESADVKEHAPEDATGESVTMIEESPSSSSKKSQEDVTESPAGASNIEPAAEEDLAETSDMAEPQVASKHVEFSSAGSEELAHEDVAHKSGIAAEESHEDLVKDLSAERAPHEEIGLALPPSEPQFVEESSAHVESAALAENAPEATDESGTMIEESSLSSSKKSQDDVTESSAGASSIEPAAEEDLGETSDEPQVASEHVEKASAGSEEIPHEDVAHKNGIAAESSSEESVKELSAERAPQEDSGMALAPSEPSAHAERAAVGENAPEDVTDESGTMIEESSLSSSKKSQDDVTESSAGAWSTEPAAEDLGETSDMAEPQVASKHVEISSAGSEEIPHEDVAHKSGIVVDSSAEESHEDLVSAERAPHEEIGMALPPPEPQFVEEPSAHVENADLGEHAQEDATDESGTIIEESPLSTSKKSQDDVTESPAGASSIRPAADEDVGEASDMVEPQVASEHVEISSAGSEEIPDEDVAYKNGIAAESSSEESVKELSAERAPQEDSGMALPPSEDPSAHVENADLGEHAPEDASDESGTMIEDSPSSSSKKSQDDVTESSAGASSIEPAAEEDLGETSDMAQPQVASKHVDISSTGSEEIPREDVAHKSCIVVDSSAEGSHEDLMKDMSAERAPHEEIGMALPPPEPQFAEEPSAHVENANLREHAPEDAADESGTMIQESPLSSLKKSQDDVTETSAGASSIEPAAEEDLGETSDMAQPQVASKHVDISSTGSEEIPREDVAHKSCIVVDSSAEGSHEDLMKDMSAERAPHEEIGMALPPPEPQFAEEPSAHVENANLREHAPEDAADESGTMIQESPLSSLKKSQDDVTETSAGASSIESAAEEDLGETSDMAEPQVASEHVEKASAGSEEIPHEDVAHKNGIAAESSSEESVKELSAERAPQEDSGMALAPSEPSAHVERAENAPEENALRECTRECTDESGTMIEESPLSTSRKSQEDVTESPAGASSIEPAAEEDLGETSDLALISAEPQVAPNHVEVSSAEEIPHEDVAFKSGIAAESSPEENQEDRVKELSAERAPQEKPSAHVESADLGEHAPEDATTESVSMVEEAPAKKSQEDVTDSSAGAPIVEPAAEDSGKKNDMAEPQVAPEFVEEVPSASGDFHELATQKDCADEDGAMLAAGAESPSEEVQKAVVKEDMQELATPEDFGEKGETTVASRGLQVPSSFVEKPSAANFEEADDDALESELRVREALAMEPQAGGDGTSLDGSNSEAPPEEFVQGSSEVREEEPAQENTGIVHPAVGSPLLASKAEEAKEDAEQEQTEAEDKIAVDEQVEDTEEASPRSQSTSDPAGSDEFKPDTLESESSGQVFYDAEDEEAFEPEQPADEPEQPSQVPDQPAQVPEQQPAQEPAQEPGQELAQVPVHQPSEEPARETEHQPAQEREYQPEQVLEYEPARARAQEPEQGFAHVPEQLPAQIPGRELAQVPEHQPAQEPDEPARETEIQPAQEREYQPELEHAREPAKERAQEPEQEFSDVFVHQPDQETDFKSAQEFAQVPAEEPEQDVAQSSEAHERDPAQDDPMGMGPASSEPQAASSSEEQQEQLADHPLKVAPDVKFEEPAQELPQQSLGGKSAHLEEERGEAPVAQKTSVDEPLVVAPRVEPAQAPAQELEAEPAQKLEPEPVQEPEAEPPRQPEVEPEVKPAQEHEAEPAQEREAESAQKPEAEPAREPEVELAREFEGEPAREPEGELARGAEVEPVREAGAEPAQQPEGEPAQQPEGEPARQPEGEPAQGPEVEPAQEPVSEPAREHEAEPAREHEAEPAREHEAEPAREHEAEPAQEREAEPAQEREAEPTQEPEAQPAREPESKSAQEHEAEPAEEEEEFHDTNEGSGPLEPVNTLEQKSFDETSVAAGTSSTPLVAGHGATGTSDHQNESSKPQVSHTLEEAEIAQVGDPDASSEVQPTSSSQEAFSKDPPAAEEPIASSESQAAPKSVKFAEEPSVVEPKSELPEQSDTDTSTTALQAPSTAITEGQQQQQDSLTAIVEETQQQQYEANHDSAEVQIPAEHKGAPEAPTIELPDAPPVSQHTETAKDKHARKKGFKRSSSEPKFDYHLHDNRKSSVPIQESTLVPTSSTASTLVPTSSTASTLVPTSSTAYQDDVDWDVQCLPFRIMSHGEGRPRRESESKSVEDIQSPTTPTNVALESKLSRRMEKKKDKERRHSFRLEPKQEKDKESRRHSLNLDALDRKGSLASTAEESDTPRAEDIVVKHHKGPFKHLRNRLRHAFSVNKDVTP